jgi:transglutaminase-like putative cysteine protease
MASPQEQKASTARVAILVSLLALQVSATAAFGRVLQGRGPTLRLCLAASVSVVLAVALERRNILLAAVVSAAALLVAIGLLVFPETLRFGLPTLTTLRAARQAFANVGQAAAVQPAPALPLHPLFLAGLTAVWASAFSSHALSSRARSPFLAIVPPAALLAFTSLVMADGVRPVYVVPFLAAALGLLFADSLWRVRQWGPVTSWHGRRFGQSMATTTRGARRVALACVTIALVAPGILPGFESPGLVDIQGTKGLARVSINPIVDIRPQLLDNPNIEVFTVRTVPANQAAYWRITSADVFTGRQWISSDPDASRGVALDGRTTLRAEGLTQDPATTRLEQHFKFGAGFYQPQLPAAFDPVGLDLPGEPIRYDSRASLLFDSNGTRPGFTYDVTSREVAPTPAQLDDITTLSGPNTAYYTKLPADTPRQISTIAHSLSDDQATPYRKILAIQDYLRRFEYSTDVKPGHDVNEIITFLTKTRKGYCEQFAGSMAVLLRALGIPARVAVGFTPGRLDRRTQSWRVTTRDAHAWVEVLFPTYGWLAFEPTPQRTNPVAHYDTPGPAFLSTPAVDLSGAQPCTQLKAGVGKLQLDQGCDRGGVVTGSPQPPQQTDTSGGARNRGSGNRGPTNTGNPVANRGHGRQITIGLVALALLLLLMVPVAKIVRRRVGVARAREPRERVLAAYSLLAAQAADVGLGRSPHETLREYRTRLKARVTSLAEDLDRLLALAARAAYSAGDLTLVQAHEATDAARHAAHEIRRSSGPVKRVAGWFRLELFSRR